MANLLDHVKTMGQNSESMGFRTNDTLFRTDGFRTNDTFSDQSPIWVFGPMGFRTNGPSNQWVFGPMGRRTNGLSDHRHGTYVETPAAAM